MTEDHERYQDWSAAYVLGSLEADEREAYEAHLEACDRCARDVRAFAPLPGLLRTADAVPVAADEPALDRIAARAKAEAHGEVARLRTSVRRWRVVAVAAGVAAAIAIGLAVAPTPADVVTTPLAVDAEAAGAAAVGVSARPWGTAIDLDATGLPPHAEYQLVAVDAAGTRQVAASWGPTPDGRAVVTGATSLAPDAITQVLVVAGEHTLVRARPDAGR